MASGKGIRVKDNMKDDSTAYFNLSYFTYNIYVLCKERVVMTRSGRVEGNDVDSVRIGCIDLTPKLCYFILKSINQGNT